MMNIQQAPGVTRNRILKFLRRYIREHGVSPTLREIADGAGLRSVGTVAAHLQRMEADGLVARIPGSPRSVVPLEQGRQQPVLRACVRCYCMVPAGCTLKNVRLSATVVDGQGKVLRQVVSSQSTVTASPAQDAAG